MATTRGQKGFFDPTLANPSGMTAVNARLASLRYFDVGEDAVPGTKMRWNGLILDAGSERR